MQFAQRHHLTKHLATAAPECLVATIEEGTCPPPLAGDEGKPQLPRGLNRKRVDKPAIRAHGPEPEHRPQRHSSDQARAILLETDYALDQAAIDLLTEKSVAPDLPPPQAVHTECYDLEQFRTDQFTGVAGQTVP